MGLVIARAKLCGIRSQRDLDTAVEAGADAIGLICGVTHLSEDALTPDRARALARRTPPFVSTVLVTHLGDAREILDLAGHIGTDTIQVHGVVGADVLAAVHERAAGRRVISAVHITGPEAIEDALAVVGHCDAVLLDSRTSDRLGGTGRTHDWSISRRIADALREHRLPVILAGGLRPENVAEAIGAVRPFAVDANTGVEDERGDKAPERCARFVAIAREAIGRVTIEAA